MAKEAIYLANPSRISKASKTAAVVGQKIRRNPYLRKDKTAENLVGTTVKLDPGKQCKFQCDPVSCPYFKFHIIIGRIR